MENAGELDQEACYRAVLTRDARFDGRFFGCVKTTGIYCRPVCPARTPNRENMFFVVTAAAAEEAGFRACLRCRPETAPDMGAWRGTSNTVSRALALIEAGALDEGDVDGLAARLGVGERHLRRLFRQHLGAAPVSVAQTRRVLLAKALIHQTDLSMAQVALASGFGSVRRFNETFQALYDRPPSALRRRGERVHEGGVKLSLSYRPPYDWDAMFAALTGRGDMVAGTRWSRRLTLDGEGADGSVTVEPAEAGKVSICIEATDLKALPGVLARVRRVFDLSADPEAIARDLSADAVLKPLVEARPGLRLPGQWIDDGVEAPSDRLKDETLTARAEAWRPWRAYGALYLAMAGINGAQLMERDDAKRAA
ncbi:MULTISPECIES: bifunctional transcriptional activator/DNA repair enzyme AdaA [unclassified Brevundimonas]|uniref:bifunctional transcriptional activator/DNA repair enzyme AdaA n=1 Tax=unclassified Brevundimonas TaxID=2622653 RepID=UPI0006FE0B28|nr:MULTISPECIES: Ada metal-binding domain-containing protein [unclassified Brevundimonas]KQY86537.1 AraC family transcriptional regulator [Brevundimonas sp. Root1423]KRA28774.1 AraC family transcriptional regulator [Brevundimonas sp. Root608]